ncbi:MAG: adenylyltransferase/cytidyltransferase family protein [Methanomicrobiales archaeon]|nr:FAD synthase [Methanomicrobiales archaeon]HMZ31357.1 FAD synthase [Methanoregulaceae archaeon]HNB03190.1 FAD synthase [Methanoregulaceae archaeon]HNL86537.1 FAD synthase [Methanoregulaceae archaeon]HNO07890.1 FAD synthase [Methanoregulaceae archaeon]
MKTVVATGTFDLLHPGHLYYLEESRRLGDELYVIIARDANVRHKPRPVIPEDQRMKMVGALKPVDHAVLGDLHDMFRPIREIQPAIITIGFNQHFDEAKLVADLRSRGISSDVVRIDQYPGDSCSSTSRIIRKVLEQYRGE